MCGVVVCGHCGFVDDVAGEVKRHFSPRQFIPHFSTGNKGVQEVTVEGARLSGGNMSQDCHGVCQTKYFINFSYNLYFISISYFIFFILYVARGGARWWGEVVVGKSGRD